MEWDQEEHTAVDGEAQCGLRQHPQFVRADRRHRTVGGSAADRDSGGVGDVGDVGGVCGVGADRDTGAHDDGDISDVGRLGAGHDIGGITADHDTGGITADHDTGGITADHEIGNISDDCGLGISLDISDIRIIGAARNISAADRRCYAGHDISAIGRLYAGHDIGIIGAAGDISAADRLGTAD
jgi:hypothetical protein